MKMNIIFKIELFGNCGCRQDFMKTMATQIKSKALFSDDGEHRLLLRREWDKSKKSAMIIMINPNTADTLNMDLTTMLTSNFSENLRV